VIGVLAARLIQRGELCLADERFLAVHVDGDDLAVIPAFVRGRYLRL
jgi:hypothetical protein